MNRSLSPMQHRSLNGKEFIGVAVAFTCYDEKSNIFLAKRSSNARDNVGYWDFGGGEVEFGHTAEETVTREMAEEYGATPLRTTFLGFLDQPTKNNLHEIESHWLVLCYAAQINHTEAHIRETHKFTDSGWFTLDDLPQPIHPKFDIFMKFYGDILRNVLSVKTPFDPKET